MSELDKFFDEAQAEISEGGRLPSERARQFILSGNAVLTFRNSESGNRFTFKIRKPSKTSPHFVMVRVGPSDDHGDWAFLGTIFEDGSYRHGCRSSISQDAQSERVFVWLWANIDDLPEFIEVWHEGRCLRCERELTVPESIRLGYGPICAEMLGIA